MYVPAVDVSTEPEVVIEEVRSPSTLSVAVAPGSVKVSPTVRLIVEEPVKVITGAVVSAVDELVVELALTVIVPERVMELVVDDSATVTS